VHAVNGCEHARIGAHGGACATLDGTAAPTPGQVWVEGNGKDRQAGEADLVMCTAMTDSICGHSTRSMCG
jgi:hypothetical protein